MTNTYFAPGDEQVADLIEAAGTGLYAVSFGGGQVEPATGDFVFGVSEGYLIENGRVTKPVTGATLTGNGLAALWQIEAIAGRPQARDRLLRQGRAARAGGRRAAARAAARADGRRHRDMSDRRTSGSGSSAQSSSRSRPGASFGRGLRPGRARRRDPRLRPRRREPDRGRQPRDRRSRLRLRGSQRLRLRHRRSSDDDLQRAREPRRRARRTSPTRTSSPDCRRDCGAARPAPDRRRFRRLGHRRARSSSRSPSTTRRAPSTSASARSSRRSTPTRARIVAIANSNGFAGLVRSPPARTPTARPSPARATELMTGLGLDIGQRPRRVSTPARSAREAAERAVVMLGAGRTDEPQGTGRARRVHGRELHRHRSPARSRARRSCAAARRSSASSRARPSRRASDADRRRTDRRRTRRARRSTAKASRSACTPLIAGGRIAEPPLRHAHRARGRARPRPAAADAAPTAARPAPGATQHRRRRWRARRSKN